MLDMLRFHKFTIGWAWKSDFGDPDDPEQYRVGACLLAPAQHQARACATRPTLITTGDHDDRVVPGHSFKFAAALQAAQGAGHGRPGPHQGRDLGRPRARQADIQGHRRGRRHPRVPGRRLVHGSGAGSGGPAEAVAVEPGQDL